MPKGYTTQAEIEKFLDTTITIDVDSFIEAAEAIIDNITGRNFIADTVATSRQYDGDSTDELLIDDAVEIDLVEVGTNDYGASYTTVDPISSSNADGYWAFIANRRDSRSEELPYTKLKLRSRSWIYGFQNHRITAKWGFSVDVPADVMFAATVIAAGIYNTGHGSSVGTGEIKSEKIGNYSVTYDVGTTNGSTGWSAFTRSKEILESYIAYSL